jgi:dCMP deaminase
MLLIFEAPDKHGKTELAKRLSRELELSYIKLNNINIEENKKIDLNVSISTHSQLETVTQLYEAGVIKDAIFDRFHASEFVYNNLFGRNYDLGYIKGIEDRLLQSNDVILIRPIASPSTVIKRWGNENIIQASQRRELDRLYDEFYKNTKLDVIEIDTDKDIEVSFMLLMGELYKRGIMKGKSRLRRWSHEETMITIAKIIAKRGTCLNRQVGAVLTENGYIVGVGYNGPPSGLHHCSTCLRRERNIPSGQSMELSRALHAEENAIIQSGIRNKSDKELHLFSTDSPCIGCMRKLIQIGIKKIYYINRYNDELSWLMAEEAGIEMIKLDY